MTMDRPVRYALRLALAACCTVAVLLAATPADAHSGDQSYLYVDVTESSLTGRVELPMVDLRQVLGLTLDGGDDQRLTEIRDNMPAIHRYLDEHFEIGPDGDPSGWTVTFGDPELFYSDAPEVDDNYVIVPFEVAIPADAGAADVDVPRRFDVRFDAFFDEADGRDALLLIGNDWQSGIIENGRDDLATFDPDTRVHTVDLGNPSWFKNFRSSIKLGVNHIRTGPDHILFVLVLLLPSVLVFRAAAWQPTARFGAALWRVLKIVTMFTVAHSITFTLAGLGLLPLPSPRIVESIIALSIAAAALHNIRPLAANKEWLISFAFGLFHGMGFASLVSGLDVSRGTQLVSLLGRNVGIEIGQAVVVVLLFPALFILRRTTLYRPLLVGVSILLAVVATLWMVERLFETDLGVSDYVDPVFAWPRIVFFVAAFTAAAGAWFRFERSRERLLPVVGTGVTDTVERFDGVKEEAR